MHYSRHVDPVFLSHIAQIKIEPEKTKQELIDHAAKVKTEATVMFKKVAYSLSNH